MVTVTIYFGWSVNAPAQIDDLLLESLKTWDLNRPTTVPSQRCPSHLKNDKLAKAKNDGAFSANMKDQQFLPRYNFWEFDLCYSNSSRGASHCCSRGGCLPAGGRWIVGAEYTQVFFLSSLQVLGHVHFIWISCVVIFCRDTVIIFIV